MWHKLKTWPTFFKAVSDGTKNFEIRKNDRDFKVGDVLELREWNPETGEYTGRRLERVVTYILSGSFGVASDHVVMAIKKDDEPWGICL